jgi:hypothetical protein
MPFSNRLVLIEFTKDTDKRKAGTRVTVDTHSATSFCDKLKVAKRVSPDQPVAAPVAPEPAAVVVDVEPMAIPSVDVDADY